MCIPLNTFMGMSLLTGAVFTGWLSCAVALLKALFYGQILFNRDIVVLHVYQIFNDFLNKLNIENVTKQSLGVGISILAIILLGVCVLDVITSMGLIFGSNMGSIFLITTWLVYEAISLVIRILVNLIAPFVILDKKVEFHSEAIYLLFFLFVLNVVSFWTWAGVYSCSSRIRFYEHIGFDD